jgi:hypothetical protein
MDSMEEISEHFKLARTIEDVFMFARRSRQIDFVADGASYTPVVATFGIGWAILENGAPSI